MYPWLSIFNVYTIDYGKACNINNCKAYSTLGKRPLEATPALQASFLSQLIVR